MKIGHVIPLTLVGGFLDGTCAELLPGLKVVTVVTPPEKSVEMEPIVLHNASPIRHRVGYGERFGA